MVTQFREEKNAENRASKAKFREVFNSHFILPTSLIYLTTLFSSTYNIYSSQ
jgi:hypothetical protein